LVNEYFLLKISRCVFQGKVGRFKVTSEDRVSDGDVYIKSKTFKNRIRVHGIIADSIFRELAHEFNGFALSFRIHEIFSTGKLSISNTVFLNNENAVFVYGGFDVRIDNVTINSTYGYAIMASGPPKVSAEVVGINVFLDRCILGNNKAGIKMTAMPCLEFSNCSAGEQKLVVKNSLFLGGNETLGTGDAIRFRVKSDVNSQRPTFLKASVLLENVTFQGLHDCAMYANFQKNVQGRIFLRNCKFINNSQFVYKLDERATVQIEFEDEDPPNSCLKLQNNSEVVQNNTTQIPVIFDNSIFVDNVGIAAVLSFLNGNVSFKNCVFKDNKGLTLGGHVYMKTGYGRINVVNSTFIHTHLNDGVYNAKQRQISSNGCFLHSDSAGPIIVTNSSFTAIVSRQFIPIFAATKTSLIKVDANSTLRCPSGKRVKLDKMENTEGFEFTKGSNTCWMKVNFVKFFCEECPDEFYSLQRGMATGLDINKRTECLKCPYGASCENGNVKARENFWGLNISTNPPSLQFFPCPFEYCSSPSHLNQYTFSGCHGNRSGVLCGQCSDGYSEALYSTSCRKKDECNDHWFWLATVIYVVVFAVYFVFKPPIFSKLYKETLWFKKTTVNTCVQPSLPEESDELDSGYLKIVFYFYQVAELVMIKSPEKVLPLVPFIPPVIAFFNFQVKTLDGGVGCPFPGLNVVTKQLFLCSKFLATLVSIGVIYAIHQATSKTGYISSPSLTLYLSAALEILLLGYKRLVDTTLKLMHCVPIGMDWRLFVDGNIQCWQWWQYLMIAFIVMFVIPLILVLFWGSLLLARNKLSDKEFLIACVFPLPCLLVWSFRQCKKKNPQDMLCIENSHDAKEIKKILQSSFREPSNGDHGALYWESVLTGRRLILLTICTFVVDPMVRFVCLNCACLLILVHHLVLRPFRDRKANIFESLSLMSLVAICTFSLAEVTHFSEGTEPRGPSQTLFRALQWIEIGLLSLVPAAVFILVMAAALSQVLRLMYHCIRLLPSVPSVLYSYATQCKCFFRDLFVGRLSTSRQLLLQWDSEELLSVA